MVRNRLVANWTERGRLLAGVVALVLATVCVVTLGTLGITSGVVAGLVGLVSVFLLVVGTLSIGTSESARV